MDALAEVVPESGGLGPTPYGMGILAAFGCLFLVLIYRIRQERRSRKPPGQDGRTKIEEGQKEEGTQRDRR